MNRFLALLPVLFAASAALAAPGLKPGGLTEFNVELPRELRQLAGRGQVSPVAHALVTIAVPANFDPSRDWPVIVISATVNHSSRSLLDTYANTALGAGWIVLAADPVEHAPGLEDDLPLRYALNIAALAALELQWRGAGKAQLAFGGFSGGAKNSGWLAAAFASRDRSIIGIYLAGINEDTIVSAARHFKVLNDAYRHIPVFLQSGDRDDVATPADHQRVREELIRAGFANIRVEQFPGLHVIDPGPLLRALNWFRELAARPTSR
jgi:predicted esterase